MRRVNILSLVSLINTLYEEQVYFKYHISLLILFFLFQNNLKAYEIVVGRIFFKDKRRNEQNLNLSIRILLKNTPIIYH